MSRGGWSWRIGLIALLIVGALSTHWIAPLRPARLDEHAASIFTVTSSADSGPGSLREALFAAARAQGSARIRLAVPRIRLDSPLPPAAQAVAIVIETDAHTVIDAQALAAGAVIDIEAPRAILRDVTVEHAAGTAFLIHAEAVQLNGIAALDSDIGLTLVGEAPHVDIRDCTMSRNRIGVELAAPIAGIVQGCKFAQHAESAVWGVEPAGAAAPQAQLKIADNLFTADRDAVVLANLPVTLEHNQFIGSLRNAIMVLGGGNVTLRGNRIRDAAQNGILIDSADHITVIDNEIGRSPGTGILVKSSSGVSIEHNRIYGNTYGIVQVLATSQGAPLTVAHNLLFSQTVDGLLIIGASPVVSDNRSINNAGAGIKVLNIVHEGRASVQATPLLTGNVTAGNAQDGIVRGAYSL
jgi:nitrous oxidase accessory protein NosD